MNLIEVETWSQEQLIRLLEQLVDRFGGGNKTHGVKWADKLQFRYEHYHMLPAADPVLPAPWDAGQLYQADMSRVGGELIARLSENHFQVKVRPLQANANDTKRADDLALALNSGIALVEERQGMSIQQELGYHQAVAGVGILHWQKADFIYPALPPEDANQGHEEQEAEAQLPIGDEVEAILAAAGEDFAAPSKSKPFSMRDPKGFLDKRAKERARAGFPWYVECPDPATVMWVPDRSVKNGFGVVAVGRDVGLLDYERHVRDTTGETVRISLNEGDKRLLIFEEMDAPPAWSPSAANDGAYVRVWQVWFRNEFYELAANIGAAATFTRQDIAGATLVRSCEHPYEQPPFAFAPAVENNQADPVLRYEPLLEGMFRVKPILDRNQSLMDVITEMTALPRYYLKRVDGEGSLVDADGRTVVLSADAAQAMATPDGYELVKIEFEMAQSFVNRVQQLREEFNEAAPGTGAAEVTASTQPWAIRLQQAQGSVMPSLAIRNQNTAINTMVRNMVLVHSKGKDEGGFGEPVDVLTRGDNTTDGKVVRIVPEEIQSLDVSTEIDATSAAEKISNIQFLQGLLNDPKAKYSSRKFLEEALNDPDPDETIMAYEAEEVFAAYVKPGLVVSEVQRQWGGVVVMGPDGQFYTAQGQPISPMDVLAMNGQQSSAGGGMPGLPGMQTPGTRPLSGMAG